MSIKQKSFIAIAVLLSFGLGFAAIPGCNYLTKDKVAAIHKTVGTVLEIAYQSGGAALVEQKIDAMVKDGKITAEQAAALKTATKQSYDALQKKLAELSVKDIQVQVTE